MVSLRTRERQYSGPVTGLFGQRWKTRLTSVCVPIEHVAVTMCRSSWTAGARCRSGLGSPLKEERYADD
jgi:hypothetical protein